jgi:PAS domain S-box-containing protein
LEWVSPFSTSPILDKHMNFHEEYPLMSDPPSGPQTLAPLPQATPSLDEAEIRFRRMADHAPVIIWLTAPDGAGTYLSQPWYTLTGQTPETALGFGWLEAVHPEDRDRAGAMFKAAHQPPAAFRIDYRLRRQDVELVHPAAPDVITRPFRRFPLSWQVPAAEAVRTGQPIWISSRQDYLERYPHLSESFAHPRHHSLADQEYALTLARQGAQALERARAEEALRLSEARFHTLSNAVPSIVWTATPEGTFNYFNAHGIWYTGQATETLARHGVKLILHPADYGRYLRAWTRAMVTVPEEFLIEARYRRHDGQYRWFQTRAIPVHAGARKVRAWYGVTPDIHDRIEAEGALRASEQKLQLLNETLAQKVQAQTLAVRTLAADLAKAEQRERHRIAQILHDDLQQRLYALQMQLDLLNVSSQYFGAENFRSLNPGHFPAQHKLRKFPPVF